MARSENRRTKGRPVCCDTACLWVSRPGATSARGRMMAERAVVPFPSSVGTLFAPRADNSVGGSSRRLLVANGTGCKTHWSVVSRVFDCKRDRPGCGQACYLCAPAAWTGSSEPSGTHIAIKLPKQQPASFGPAYYVRRRLQPVRSKSEAEVPPASDGRRWMSSLSQREGQDD